VVIVNKCTSRRGRAKSASSGGTLLLATIPTALFMLCRPGFARAEDYFDPAALELSSPQQKTADLHYFATQGGQQPGTYPVSISGVRSAQYHFCGAER